VLVADPLGVVNFILLDLAPPGTLAWIAAAETTVKLVALTPPKVTCVAPGKPPWRSLNCPPPNHEKQVDLGSVPPE